VNVIVKTDVEAKERRRTTMTSSRIRPWATETACRADTEEWLRQHTDIIRGGLSQEAAARLFELSQQHHPYERPSWDEIFLQVAHDVSKRSPDSQTQVGAVIVDYNHHIIGVGYNGWMPGIDDTFIPNTRPHKYRWSIHAELNAIFNCEHKPRGATLYSTARPCVGSEKYPGCIQHCVAAGLREVVYIESSTTHLSHGDDVDWEVVTWLIRDKLTVRGVDFTPQG
jgi:dCMP deaminase